MPILQAIGLGVLIIVLKFLAPAVLSEGEKTVVAFLHGAFVSATVATDLAASAGTIPLSQEPFVLPHVTPIQEP
ncbi:MAG: hypothetical protein AB199_01830 [Parcubacteria bacterium C7867-004]|nr:MAG: hypothetical protein AB199_01830 [Parcubacteria bacterium C7867-004]